MRILLAVALLFLSSLASAQIGPGGGGGGCSSNCTFTGLTTTAPVSAGGTVSVSAGAGVTNSLTITNNGTITATVTPAAAASFGGPVTSPTLTSTVATGTAPFTVTSTTNVANLNASSLSGATMANPGTIGGGTPAAGTFTTLTANTSLTTTLIKSATTISIQGQAASSDGATVTNNAWNFVQAVTSTLNGNAGFVNNVGNSVGFGRNASSGAMNLYGGANASTDNNADGALSNGMFTVIPGGGYSWSSTTNAGNPTRDTGITRCAAGVVCVGNGTSGDTTGSIKGVTTNSSAPAGSIGEEREFSVASTGAVVTVSSNTAVTVTSSGAVVTAGDYDVTGVVCYSSAAATSFTVFQQGVSTTTNVLGALGTSSSEQLAAMVPGTITLGTSTAELCKPVPRTRVSLSGTGTIFLIARPVFSVSANISGYGQMMIRRVR